MFKNSPIYNLTAADYRAIAQGLLLPSSQLGDPTFFPNPVDMNYTASPDLSTPPAGFDTSYYPNLIVNPDPAGGEGTATGTPLEPNDNFGTPGSSGIAIPAETAGIISQATLNINGAIAPLGQSGANTSSGVVTTHIANPGALTS
jgi:hypothetical protein